VTQDQAVVVAVLVATLGLFIWGRWRYDVVALIALLALVLTDIVPGETAFAGFGHPAVVTVAAVLVVSRGLQNSGMVDTLARWLSRAGSRPTAQVASSTGLVAVLSGFMNNIGALALLMPVAIRVARGAGNRPSMLLMPLAFGSLLGGLVTLVGTPPNIVIASFRAQNGADPFGMFDFAPVGLGVMVAGVTFISLVGWRLIPHRDQRSSDEALFEIENYLTEVRVPADSPMVGKMVRDVGAAIEADIVIVAVLRDDERRPAPSSFELLRAGDVLVVEVDTDALQALIDAAGLEAVGNVELPEELLGSEEVELAEAVVMPGARVVGRTAFGLNLRRLHGLNLLAVARQGAQLQARLGSNPLRAGDVLLVQGPAGAMAGTLSFLGCLPLAERGLSLGRPPRVLVAVMIFASALVLAAALRLIPIQVAITAAALVMGLAGLVSVREAYDAIDWPVIVLLGAMIPVGGALEQTGGAAKMADVLVSAGSGLPSWAILAVVLVAAMFLSDVVNNAAAAVLMAPIAISVSEGLEVSADPFLMAVAIGASAAFLTPIGHQSNILVMGPGGYRFGDYWRMGLPLEMIVAAVAVPLILIFWPL
jgi:di/tricarboxylate transporter